MTASMLGTPPASARPAGDYDQRIAIEVNAPTDGASGQSVPAWSTVLCRRWANIAGKAGGGRQVRRFEQLRPEIDQLVAVRYDQVTKTINPTLHRVNWGGRILNIVSADDVDNRHFEIVIQCTEVQQ